MQTLAQDRYDALERAASNTMNLAQWALWTALRHEALLDVTEELKAENRRLDYYLKNEKTRQSAEIARRKAY